MSQSEPSWTARYPAWVPHVLPPAQGSVADLLERAAHERPDSPAVHYFRGTLRYAELEEHAARFATLLAHWGIDKGERVALYLQNVPQFLIAAFGAWKRGAIVVPLNPMLKERELEYHLNDSGARVLVALESLYATVAKDVVPKTAVETVVTTSELDLLGDQPHPSILTGIDKQRLPGTRDLLEELSNVQVDRSVRREVGPSDVASLGYTSGTTGLPKGAMSTHGNIVYNSHFYRIWMKLTQQDVVLGVAPLFHITGMVAHIGAAAAAQCPLVLAARFDAKSTLELIELWRTTMTVASITVFLALLNHPDARKEGLSSLTKCYSGGAPIAPATVERFEAQFGVYIHNVYGMTETASPTHAVPLGARAPVDPLSGALSVGVPIPGLQVCLIDLEDSNTEAPIGQPGELCDKGPMLFAGYWNKPDATKAAFRDGFFFTGDVATRDADGYFFIVDRKKDMIIASGYKVWPREVEDVLFKHPAVREAAVVGVPDEYRGETVKAFVALKAGQATTVEELIEHCKKNLASYKYPRQLELVDEIPKTATGKFLRRVLRDR